MARALLAFCSIKKEQLFLFLDILDDIKDFLDKIGANPIEGSSEARVLALT